MTAGPAAGEAGGIGSAGARRLRVLLVSDPDGGSTAEQLTAHGLEVHRHDTTKARSAVEAARALAPDVVVVEQASIVRALHTVADLVDGGCAVPILTLGLPDDETDFLAVVRAGAVGYLPTGTSPEAVARAVNSVAQGNSALPRHLGRALAEAFHNGVGHVAAVTGDEDATLTAREWEVLQLVWQGRSTRQIAEHLFISAGTVRTHLAVICRKVGVGSRADLLDLVERPHAAAGD